MPELGKGTQIALALAMPASVIIAYWLYSRWSSDEEWYGKQKVATSHTTRIKLEVPSKAVGTIIGKQGFMIKKIQADTGARLNFCDRMEDRVGKSRTLMIMGSSESAQKAELIVYQIIADMPEILTEEIKVPSYCVGRIIGKGGCIIRDIRRASNVKIDIDKQEGESPDGMKNITLAGSRKQIDIAIELIEEIVKEAELERHEKESSRWNSSKEKFVPREKGSLKASAVPVEEEDSTWESNDGVVNSGEMNGVDGGATGTNDFIQVMVSAVEHPGHFWAQMVGPKSLHLEQLQKDLSEQLTSEDVRESLIVTDPEQGDMVAAKFEDSDPVYYRARVEGVMNDGSVDLYFVDYGDNVYAKIENIFRLRSEFHQFPHQAIQCQLASVQPLNDSSGWTDENITLFEDLVSCAQWKPLYAKVVTYARIQGQEGQGEGHETLRPCMQLVDTSGEKDVDVAEEMIRQGHAKRVSATQDNHSNTL